MATFVGLTKKQLLEKEIAGFKRDIKFLVESHDKQIEELIKGTSKADKRWGYVVNDPLSAGIYSVIRGVFNGALGVVDGLNALVAGVANNIGHILDGDDGTKWYQDIAITLNDAVAQTIQGVANAGVGVVADVGGAFGADTKWAYGEDGALAQIDKAVKSKQAELIGREEGKSDKEIVDSRWSDRGYSNNVIETMTKGFEGTQWFEDNVVNKITFKEQFDEQYQNNPGFQQALGAVESVARIIPAIMITKAGKGAGWSPQTTQALSTGYFGSSVFGESFTEAIRNGTSMDDAYTYAMGSASLELMLEQFGGFNFTSQMSESILKNVMEEAIEEAVAEFGARGVGYTSTPDHVIEQESAKEIWKRVGFSAVVGGLAGGAMGAGNLHSVEGKTMKLEESLGETFDELGIEEGTKNVISRLETLNKALNDENIHQKQKEIVFNNSTIVQELFVKDGDTYQLTEKAQRIMEGNIQAKQGEQVITKKTHAVGGENLLQNYRDSVNLNGEDVEIKIVEREALNELDQDVQEKVNWATDNGLNVAFVETTKEDFKAFVDPETGTKYINIHSKAGIDNLIAHEINHTIEDMIRKGKVTEKQAKAYNDFLKKMFSKDTQKTLEKLGIKFDEEAYRKQYEGRDNIEELIQSEKISTIIEEAFYNDQVLAEAFREDTNMLEKVKSIFSNKLTFNSLLKSLGIKKSDLTNKESAMFKNIASIQRTFSKAIKENKDRITAKQGLMAGFGMVKAPQDLFSINMYGFGMEEDPTIYSFEELFEDEELITEFVMMGVGGATNRFPDIKMINEETNKELADKGYFVEIDGFLYNKDKFHLENGYEITSMFFDKNNFIKYNYAKIDHDMEEANQYVQFERQIIPDVQYGDTIIENPMMFEFSVGAEVLDFFANHRNLPSQSINMESVAGRDLATNHFSHWMEALHLDGTNDDIKVSFVLKPSIVQKEDFSLFGKDIYSPIRRVETNEPNKVSLAIDMNNQDFKGLEASDKMRIFKENLDFIYRYYAQKYVKGGMSVTGKTITVEGLENLKNLAIDVRTGRKTIQQLKREIKKAGDLRGVDIHDLFVEAHYGFIQLIHNDFTIYEISRLLNASKDNRSILGKDLEQKIENLDIEDYIDAINLFHDYAQYSLNNMSGEHFYSEGLLGVEQEDIGAVLITKFDSQHKEDLGDSLVVGELKKMANENGWVVLETSTIDPQGENDIKPKFQEYLRETGNKDGFVFSLDNAKGKKLRQIGKIDTGRVVKTIRYFSDLLSVKNGSMLESDNLFRETFDEFRGKLYDFANFYGITRFNHSSSHNDPQANVKGVFSDKELKALEKAIKEYKQVALQEESIRREKAKELRDVLKTMSNKIDKLAELNHKTKEPEVVEVEHQEDFLDNENEVEVLESYTKQSKTEMQSQEHFRDTKNMAKKVSQDTYRTIEDTFEVEIDGILQRVNKSKTKMDKQIKAMYTSWESYIKKHHSGRRIVNHMSSSVSKVIIKEMNDLVEIIKNDENRVDKKPTNVELEYIARKVNEAIFGTLEYLDSELTVPINVRDKNPNGYLYTRGMHWYLRDIKNKPRWTKKALEQFNKDKRGTSYRRLLNAILNLNNKKGFQELTNAMKHFAYATDVEPIIDLPLDKNDNPTPHTVNTIKKQWEQDTQNILDIQEGSGFNVKVRNFADPFTVSEVVGLFNNHSWSQVLMRKIIEGSDRQMRIGRIFDAIFDDKWVKGNHKEIKALENEEVEIENLGGVKVKMSQIIYLRNMVMREVVRNKAIDEGVIKGVKTNHFAKGYQIDILEISEIKTEKRDNKKTVKIVDTLDLLNELDEAIGNNGFAREYNERTLELFNELYPYVNERYKEINGLVLRNDGNEIQESLRKDVKEDFFDGLPSSIHIDNINQLYVPFLLDNSAYFKNEKVDFKEILDLGVFDGMTQSLTDSNGIISVESISNVLTSYRQEVANYYGLHRIMRDLNLVLNEPLDGYDQTTYIGRNIRKDVTDFYKNLLIDMAGYKRSSRDPKLEKKLSFVKRNFYKASLGANVKVMATQFATMLNLSNIYGNGYDFLPKMMKNFYAQLSKENKAILEKMEKENNFYHDRSKMSTFEVGEATKQGLTGHNAFNNFTEFLMKGIGVTDNAINKAFYLTLLETTNPETGKDYTEQEANEVLKEGILRSQSSALNLAKSNMLRTDNDVVKIFLKFTGEPLKLITQLYSSKKQIELIKKVEKNRDKIKAIQDNKIKLAQNELKETQDKLKEVSAKEDSDDIVSMEEHEQKAIRKEVKDLEKQVQEKQDNLKRVTQNAKVVEEQVENIISQKRKANTLAKRRVSAVLATMVYMSNLSVAFEVFRHRLNGKDDEEKVFNYLSKKLGYSFIDEIFSMMPYIRDAYQLVAKGYDLDNFDEIGAVNDLGRTFYYVFQAIANGNKINWGKTGRYGITSLGSIFGIPVRGLERLFTTPAVYLNEKAYYKYNMFIGAKNTDNVQLAKAIKEGNDTMIGAIVEHKISQRQIIVNEDVFKELRRLTKNKYEVKMPGINDSYTVDGVKYVLDKKQQEQFAQIYGKADFVIQKIIRSPKYRRLNDDMKQSLLLAIYNYYHKMAKQEVLDVELIPSSNYFKNMNLAYKYFVQRAESFYNKQRSSSYRKEQLKKGTKV